MHTTQILMTKKQLKDFGLLMGFMIAALFGCLIPYIKIGSIATTPLIVAGAFAGIGLLTPSLLKPVYQLWMKIGAGLGWINSRVLLSILFYGLIVPIGFILKILGKPLLTKPDIHQASYRIQSLPRPTQHMERPY